MRKLNRGFTLIELLVVVAILGILAVAALVAINPAEAQRKSRDTIRLKDVGTLQTALEQFINDNPGTLAGWPTAAVPTIRNSSLDTRACDNNWTGLNLCNYLRQVPVDPVNRSTVVTEATGVPATRDAFYYLVMAPSNTYKICVALESPSNVSKLNNLTTDANARGGVNGTATMFAAGSNLALSCPR